MGQPDTSALETLLDVGRLFGFCPWDYGLSHRNYSVVIVNMVNASITIWHVVSLRFFCTHSKALTLESLVFGVANGIAICSFLMENNGRENHWRAFMDTIRRLDGGDYHPLRRRNFHLKLLAFHVITVFILGAWSASFLYNYRSTIGSMCGIFVSILITTYKALWTSLVVRHVTDMLSCRYSRVERKLKAATITAEDIKVLHGKVVVLFHTVQTVNVMFGRSILLMIAMALVKCCYVFLLHAPDMLGSLMQPVQYFSTFCNCSQVVIFSLIIVVGCDKVKRRHENLLITANTILPHVTEYTAREELIILMGYVTDLPTEITAAGVFGLDRKLIPKFINMLLMYLIMIVQLRNNE